MSKSDISDLQHFSDVIRNIAEEQQRLGVIYREGMDKVSPIEVSEKMQKILDLFQAVHKAHNRLFGYPWKTEEDVNDAVDEYTKVIEELRKLLTD